MKKRCRLAGPGEPPGSPTPSRLRPATGHPHRPLWACEGAGRGEGPQAQAVHPCARRRPLPADDQRAAPPLQLPRSGFWPPGSVAPWRIPNDGWPSPARAQITTARVCGRRATIATLRAPALALAPLPWPDSGNNRPAKAGPPPQGDRLHAHHPPRRARVRRHARDAPACDALGRSRRRRHPQDRPQLPHHRRGGGIGASSSASARNSPWKRSTRRACSAAKWSW